MKKKIILMIIISIVSALLILISRVYLSPHTKQLDIELDIKDISEEKGIEITNKIKEFKTNNGLFYSGLMDSSPDLYTTYYATNILNMIHKLDYKNKYNIQELLNNSRDSKTDLYTDDIINNDLRSTSMAMYLLESYKLKSKNAASLFERWKQKDGFYYVLGDEFNSLNNENKLLYKVEQTSSVIRILEEQEYFLKNNDAKTLFVNKYRDLLSNPTIKNNPYILSVVIDTLRILGHQPSQLDFNLEIEEVIVQLEEINQQTNEVDLINLVTDLEGISSLYKNHLIELDAYSINKIENFTLSLLKKSFSSNDINLLNSLVKISSDMGIVNPELKERIYKDLKSKETKPGLFPFQYEPVGDFHSSLYALKILKGVEGIDSITNSSINSVVDAFNNRIEKIIKESSNNKGIPVIDVYDYISVYNTLEMDVYHKTDLEKILKQNIRHFKLINEKNIQDYYFNIRALSLLESESDFTPNNLESLYQLALKNELKTKEGKDADNLYKLMVIESYALNRGSLSSNDTKFIKNIFIQYKDMDSEYSLRIYEMGMQTLFEFNHKFPKLKLNETIQKLRRSGGYAMSLKSSSMDIVSTYRALLISEEFK
ncbi:hypothetical protein KXS12_25310 [Priestia filamentosa]|uniref:hypothetical protein n=1 Tax=Priestia filamentosa TaxID=1402861 RepID=UPI003F14ADA9